MCGISGYFLPHRIESSAERILRMTRVIAYRGPDDEGLSLLLPTDAVDLATSDTMRGVHHLQGIDAVDDLPHKVAFGHRRFSIVDVSASGHQPFWSHNRQVCVAFSGEIYNYVELRHQLKDLGHTFYTHSDTEVLVEAYLEWGTQCFQRFNGFWALSLYDARKQAVLLSRDRVGVAPLYVARTAEGVFWSSEIKGILAGLKASEFPICEQAIFDFVQHGWRDLFHTTFYQGITTFPNAAYAWIRSDGTYEPEAFWQLPQQRLHERDITPSEAIAHLKDLLSDAVRVRLRADVPLGIELSGGMDSSAITAFAAQMGRDISTFTVSFPGTDSDEEPFARKVADHYCDRITHNVLTPPPDDLFSQADQYIDLLEEPFHSPNLLTNQSTWRMMAANGMRVSLNGGAGDEVLAGYSVELHPLYLHTLLRQGRLPRFVQEFLAYSEVRRRGGYLKQVYHLLPNDLRALRRKRMTQSADAFIEPQLRELRRGPSWDLHQRLIDNMGHWRMNYWMRSSNKSAMGVPMEVRFPFLDYRVLDFAFQLPLSYLIREGWMKWILRQAVKEILPAEVVWRKVKAGFPFPIKPWLLASKAQFFTMTASLDCPYLDWQKLQSEAYETLVHRDPRYLWRMMSLALWWKKCVQGESLR